MNAFCQQEINFFLHLKKEGDGVHASRFIKLLQGIFCLLLAVESFPGLQVVKMLEKVAVNEKSGEHSR